MAPRTTTALLLACQAALLSVAVIFAPSSMAFVPDSLGMPSRKSQAIPSLGQNPSIFGPRHHSDSFMPLSAAGGNNKRKRRRRKVPIEESESATPPSSTTASIDSATPSPVKPTLDKIESVDNMLGNMEELEEATEEDIFTLKDVANFAFDEDRAASMAVKDEAVPTPTSSEQIPLPDIKETLQKKQQEELARVEEEKLKDKRKIKRSDKEAFARLLEQQPYADSDATLFEDEEYTTVSALLGEGAKKFLGIPSGPLQVGHFIGALAIILMAFVEYPGFPLTNLPTPLRDCLQGGLAITYAINLVLAVLAGFQAGSKGQPTLLWVAKTFSVGGLAYDQLSQLPTKEEMDRGAVRRK